MPGADVQVMRSTLSTLLLSAGLLGGCYADAQYGGVATVEASSPDMVSVEPGVQVIADYDYPVFYSGGAYWRYDDGFWYRSNVYTGGWGYVDRPPVAIARINSPHAYVHYRPSNYVARRRPAPQREHVVRRGPVVRDHRR
jgi:hypothetical protein